MKQFFWIFSILLLALQSNAQSNAPVRLALVSETDEASAASDILIAQLSGNQKIHLLERDEIEKVYREQGMSAANRDDLKLGHILGADGLLLLDIVRTKQATNLMVRLIAVKPGVVLTDGSFAWPLKDSGQWAESVSAYLNSFLPKLSVLVKDAVPISVVNLRSAISSSEAGETERQLKLLTIQRLSREPQFFVLERQKMQLLTEEKDLKLDDSAFWNGSYLLEGVVDQNGYSKETITINARLTPTKGSAPLFFEVSGNRTNLAEVINQLAVEITDALKINSAVKEWNAADEAAQYFDEAKWALRWGVYSEAEAAADSAWALGKHDLDCATVRVKAYEVPPDTGGYQQGTFFKPCSTNNVLQMATENAAPNRPLGLILQESDDSFDYAFVGKFPDPRSIDFATRALELYYAFSQNSSEDSLIKVASEESGWKNSDWYNLGIEDLTVASQVLQHFHFVPESQATSAEKLAGLRALARSVSEWISKSSSVHDSYFVGDRVVTHDELANTIEVNPNIFRCKLDWGCFWQEKPEDCVALYRELMSSPAFCYIHGDLWIRELQTPRLAAWDETDRKRIPSVWNDIIQELNSSTNVLLQLEAKAIKLADADDEKQLAESFTNLFSAILENRDALVANNIEVLYLDWDTGNLVNAKVGSGIGTDTKESLQQLYNSEYRPKLEAMDQEYWSKTVTAGQFLSTFENQKRYLKENKPYDFMEFAQLFSSEDYSKVQALEIQPLVAAYKSNLVAQSQNASMMQKAQLMGAVAQVGFLEKDVDRILNPQPQPQPKVQVAKTVAVEPTATNATEIVTNVITVNKFFPIPLDSLYHLSDGEQLSSSNVSITAHHWFEEKLLLDFRYSVSIEWGDGKGVFGRTVAGDAIGIFNPVTQRWSIIDCLEAAETSHIMSQNNFYHRSALLHGELFTCDEKQIKKYDFQNQQWNLLSISDGNNYELFAVNGHLYAANQNTISEIVNDGKETHILASTRRQPPASALDTQDLGTPTLFEGPNHSLRVCTSNKIYTWTGNDWREDCAVPRASFPPEIFSDGILFRWEESAVPPLSFFSLSTVAITPELCLSQNLPSSNNGDSIRFHPLGAASAPKPLWKSPPELFFAKLPASLRQSDLYLLVDHSEVHEIANDQHIVVQEQIVGKGRYNAMLLCFSDGLSQTQKLFLNFDAPDGCPPTAGINPSDNIFPVLPPAWMLFGNDSLFFGLENPRNSIPAFNQADRIGIGYKTGIWLLPFSQIELAIAGQKQTQLEQMAREAAEKAAAKEKAQKAILSKYDYNHNGIIDPHEKEEALDDPAFIESELDVIDANHNGWLDAAELGYFDANQNKILEPKEQAGIDIAQHLFAERLLKKFDANGDGLLDRPEFNNLFQLSFAVNTQPMNAFLALFPDDNQDGKIDLGELEAFLKQQTRKGLRSHGIPGAVLFNQMRTNINQPVDPRQMFKAAVEFYWQNPGGNTSGTQGRKVQ